MKHRFTASIRGNVNFTSSEELVAAVMAGLKTIPGFTLESHLVETWVDNDGTPRDFDGLKRFTISISGTVLADNEEAVRSIITSFCKTYPQFQLTWQSIEGWMMMGVLQDFNDDGSIYTPPVETPEEEAIKAIQEKVNEEPVVDTTPSAEERIAAALEYQTVASMPDADTETTAA
jgi:hypothetical protein